MPSCGGVAKYVHATGDVSRTICGPLIRYSTACSGRSCGRTGNLYEDTRWTWASCTVSCRRATWDSCRRTHKVVWHLRAQVAAAGIVCLIHAVHVGQRDATTVPRWSIIRKEWWADTNALNAGVGPLARWYGERAHRDFHAKNARSSDLLLSTMQRRSITAQRIIILCWNCT